MNNKIHVDIYSKFVKSILEGNRKVASEITNSLIEQKIDIRIIYENLFRDALYEVGHLWENNKISVATEHLATAIVELQMSYLYPQIFSVEHIDKTAVVACVKNEYHQVGAKMVADVFEFNKWHGYFLGANTPGDELIKFIDVKKPDLICLSLSIYNNIKYLLETIDTVKATFNQINIIIGGQAFIYGGIEKIKDITNVDYIETLIKLENKINEEST